MSVVSTTSLHKWNNIKRQCTKYYVPGPWGMSWTMCSLVQVLSESPSSWFSVRHTRPASTGFTTRQVHARQWEMQSWFVKLMPDLASIWCLHHDRSTECFGLLCCSAKPGHLCSSAASAHHLRDLIATFCFHSHCLESGHQFFLVEYLHISCSYSAYLNRVSRDYSLSKIIILELWRIAYSLKVLDGVRYQSPRQTSKLENARFP